MADNGWGRLMFNCLHQSAPRRAAMGCVPLLAVFAASMLLAAAQAVAAGGPSRSTTAPAGTGTTPAPSLTAPASGAVTTGSVTVSFDLPQAPQVGSVELVFAGASTYVLTLSDSVAGAMSLSINPANPVASSGGVASISGGSSIAPGVYTVTLSYQDANGDPAAETSAGSVAVSACPPGSYSATGFDPCTFADPGHYVGGPGATAELPCAAGTFAAAMGTSSCVPALAGTYAPLGTAIPTPCPAGSFCPAQSGAPTACPQGAYCPAQSGAPTPCKAGTFNPGMSAAAEGSCQTVPAGSYAGAGAGAAAPCPAGSWCAQGAAAPSPGGPGSYAPAPGSSGCLLA
ncbi:MAG: hypothetical protein ACYCXW_17165, partial [Solirubrobacteraceae bacterium]